MLPGTPHVPGVGAQASSGPRVTCDRPEVGGARGWHDHHGRTCVVGEQSSRHAAPPFADGLFVVGDERQPHRARPGIGGVEGVS